MPSAPDILRQSMLREQSVSELAKHYAMSFAAVQKHVLCCALLPIVTGLS